MVSQIPRIAHAYGTPTYIYDFDKISQNVADFKGAFSARKSLLCYALKANSNLSLLRHLAQMDCGADCVSINEVKRALLAGIPKYKIIYSGVGKSDSDIETALEKDILFINIESVGELLRVEAIAKSLGKVARISVRVNPNIDAKTHPYISTGLNENKFGVEIESAKKIFIHAKKSPFLEPIAVHFHIGSQLLELSPIIESAKKIVALIKGLLALKIDIKFIDIGGGLGIAYNNEKIIDFYDYAQGILGELRGLDLTIICELGRRIVGDCGVLVAKVLYEKQNEFKRFCIVDAAMNDLVRPTLYGAKHRIKHIPRHNLSWGEGNLSWGMQFRTCENFWDSADSKSSVYPKNSYKYKSHTAIASIVDSAKLQNLAQNHAKNAESNAESTLDSAPYFEKCDIVGPICESGDFLAKDIALPRTKRGDLIAILDCGAYGFSMSSNYNSRLKCAEVALKNGEFFLIRKRESFAESIQNEGNCLKNLKGKL